MDDFFLSRYEMNSCRDVRDWSWTRMILGTTAGSGDETNIWRVERRKITSHQFFLPHHIGSSKSHLQPAAPRGSLPQDARITVEHMT